MAARLATLSLLVLGLAVALAQDHPTATLSKQPEPALRRDPRTAYALHGVPGEYLRRVSDCWLKQVPAADPAILDMFRDRDRLPPRRLEPWAGEFAGKYLTGCVQVYRLTGDPELRALIERFVADLVSLQDGDGYLGPWPRGHRLTGSAPNAGAPRRTEGGPTWDAWGHYHVMLGLLLWHQESGDTKALACSRRVGDLFCDRFLGDKRPRLVDTGSTEMNLAPAHALCLLYDWTQDPRHLALARQLVAEFAATDAAGRPLAGDYLNSALAGKEFYQCPKPRWESLHPILALARLYYLTGEEKYRRAFEHWWWSIVRLDRHNTGGFSSGEQAQGDPYHRGAIETCCTIAWLALSAEMLQLTGNSVVADELELTTLNSGLGLFSPSGRWSTYDTPMDGVRRASTQDIVFQAREGSPELNCCSVNAARGLGLVSEWALLQDREGLVLNWYGPSELTARLPSGTRVTLAQETDYPVGGRVRLRVSPERPEEFTLKLRIPSWSERTRVAINGDAVLNVRAGQYLPLRRSWMPGDVVDVELDLRPHYWAGEKSCAGRVSVYRGPVLLTYDRRFNDLDPAALPALDARELEGRPVAWGRGNRPWLLLEYDVAGGRKVRLCDFASAGDGGSPYQSWLRAEHCLPAAFSRENPLRTSRRTRD